MNYRLRALMKKEWQEAFKNKMVLFGITLLPLIFLGFAAFMLLQAKGLPPEAPPETKFILINQTMFYFILLPLIIPLSIAVYAVTGEKEQKSLEPLLATPLTDLELFAGKVLAAAIPGVVISWLFFGLFLGVASLLVTPDLVLTVLAPPWLLAIFLLSPLVAIFTVTVSMLISSRMSDTRAAYQLSSFAVLPVVIPIFIFGLKEALLSLGLIALEAGIVALVDLGTVILAAKLFQREQILVRWK
ncbi:MAG: ABC transporter permease subunit [Candidatus Acetothermia bacterium]|jgi:ABC-2 type transport system permease protein|nr:ABC transporter permease subunit [Candidatus Acetothermia bacterium]MDH7505774.1 ABC transporter permease subunit [Candidatus Acetothermia bacterium]